LSDENKPVVDALDRLFNNFFTRINSDTNDISTDEREEDANPTIMVGEEEIEIGCF